MARHRARYRVEGLRRENGDRGQPAEARVRRLSMMHGPLPDQIDRPSVAAGSSPLAALERALGFCNNIIVVFYALALVAGCVIRRHSVPNVPFLLSPTSWPNRSTRILLVT